MSAEARGLVQGSDGLDRLAILLQEPLPGGSKRLPQTLKRNTCEKFELSQGFLRQPRNGLLDTFLDHGPLTKGLHQLGRLQGIAATRDAAAMPHCQSSFPPSHREAKAAGQERGLRHAES